MSGTGHIIVGATGTGKTTFVKKLLVKVRNKQSLFVYDINQEYTDFYPEPLLSFDEFIKNMSKLSNSVQVYEEATIFLDARSTNEYLRSVLVRKRHQNNYVFLNFHSLRQVPLWVYNLSTHITVFKTNDSENLVKSRFQDDKLTEIFNSVQNSRQKYFNKTLKIY